MLLSVITVFLSMSVAFAAPVPVAAVGQSQLVARDSAAGTVARRDGKYYIQWEGPENPSDHPWWTWGDHPYWMADGDIYSATRLRYSSDPSRCLSTGSKSNGADMILVACGSAPYWRQLGNQVTMVNQDGEKDGYDGQGLCLDMKDGGLPVQVWECTPDNTNQKWALNAA